MFSKVQGFYFLHTMISYGVQHTRISEGISVSEDDEMMIKKDDLRPNKLYFIN